MQKTISFKSKSLEKALSKRKREASVGTMAKTCLDRYFLIINTRRAKTMMKFEAKELRTLKRAPNGTSLSDIPLLKSWLVEKGDYEIVRKIEKLDDIEVICLMDWLDEQKTV